MVAELRETQFKVAAKDEEIERVKEDYKEQLVKKQEEIADKVSQLTVKDAYI